jgi:hypothetical protein
VLNTNYLVTPEKVGGFSAKQKGIPGLKMEIVIIEITKLHPPR